MAHPGSGQRSEPGQAEQDEPSPLDVRGGPGHQGQDHHAQDAGEQRGQSADDRGEAVQNRPPADGADQHARRVAGRHEPMPELGLRRRALRGHSATLEAFRAGGEGTESTTG
ncbi:hypothetical protein SDC9_206557 [bioreactor metagenome]|uniref:Uncharacterized protein n=1 Tax=bioreactor metagenome TaxID=1076179 RepID=A0A645J5E2_9ZZZZ